MYRITKQQARDYAPKNWKFVYFDSNKRHGQLPCYQREVSLRYSLIRVPVKYLPVGELEQCIKLGVTY